MKKALSFILALVMVIGLMPMTAFASDNTEAEESPWRGRSAVFVGDSITAGSGTTKKYFEYLAQMLDLGSVTGMGIGGSCISSGSDYGNNNTPLINRYKNIPSADLIQIFMGTNDYGHATPIGSPEDMQAETFYGALNTIIPYLLETRKESKIVFVTPLHRNAKSTGTTSKNEYEPNASGHTLHDYVEAIKQVCAMHGVSVIDLYSESEMDPRLDPKNTAYFPDGLHPNAAGHELIAGIMESHIREYEPVKIEPIVQTELIQGNKFSASNDQPCRASSRVNYYLKAGTVITLRDPDVMQWACAKTNGEISSTNLGYFPDSQWTDKETAVVAEDGWVGFVFKYRDETQIFDLSKSLSEYITIEEPHTHSYKSTVTVPTCTEQGYTTYTCECGDSYTSDVVAALGHDFSQSFVCSRCDHVAKVSVLGDSISTYAGFSAVKNAVYPNKTIQSVEDTWWKQVVDTMGAQLLVNNASGGSRVLSDEYFNGNGIREGNYAAYRDRCVNLHDGDEKPDVIFVFMGTNDFSYHVDGNCEKCQILLNCSECTAREDGNLNVCSKCRSISGIYSSFCNLPLGIADSVNASAEVPTSVCEAYAIMLSKMKAAYPNAQIYCMGLLPRVNPYQNATYHDHGQPTAFNAELKKVAENAGARFISLEQRVDNSASTWNTYFGDAVHPTAIGMDKISAAVLTDVLGKEIYTVSSQIVSSAVTMTGESWAMDGAAYEASVITLNPDLQLDVRVIMNGVDVTENVFNAQTGRIYIVEVTGNILITVKTEGIFWSIGTINTINGADADDYKNRIRTDYISVNEGVTVRASNDAEINVVYFDANYKILSANNNTGWIKEWTSVGAPTAAAYIRAVARATSGTNLTTEYSQNVTITCGHVHDYIPTVTAPTCTEQGYTTYTCECGDSYVDDVSMDITDRFKWNEGYVISAFNGNMMADKNWVASDYVDISAFESIEIVTGDTVNANTTLGIAFYDANKKFVSGVVHTDKTGTEYGILVHNLEVPQGVSYLRTTWYSVNHGSYNGATLHTFYCKGAGTAIPPLGHDYVLTEETKPNCSAGGTKVYICSRCGESTQETTSKGDHAYDNGICIGCGSSILGNDWIAPNFAEGDYSMVVLPDTQKLVTSWEDTYYEQMQWIADNEDALNIQAVLHMGDMVDNNTAREWTICEAGTDILQNAGIPWMPMRGNHDDADYFNNYYDYTTYGTNQSWFGGSYHADKLDHTYWFVTAGNREYMILSLGWAPSWDVLAWAQDIVEAHSDKNVILTCHAYMNSDGTLLDSSDAHCPSSYHPGYPDGDDVWDAFKGYENVVLAMGGHIHSANIVTFVDQNGTGRDVTSLLVDRQNDDMANHYGMVAVLTFHSGSNTVDVNWYSVRYDALYRAKNQFSIDVPHVHSHEYVADITVPTCTEKGYTTYTCECGDSYVDSYVEALGHTYENGICVECGKSAVSEAEFPMDLFVFAGQSNMMGAAVLEPKVNTFAEQAWEYKYMPKLRGAETGAFVPAQNSAGEWYYNDLNAAYGENLYDLAYQSSLSNYSKNTYFCPAMSNGTKGFSAQSEADMYPSASIPPYFATEYASYGHSSIYAHMAKGAVKIVHYFTPDMVNAYNALISTYNAENGKSYKLLSAADLTGAGDAFDEKYKSMLEDYAACSPSGSINNKCFVWLQGEGDGGSYIEYKLKMQVLWEHLQTLGFTHFFVLRVGYWGNTGILNIIKAQEDFCAENEGCHIVTRAPSLIPYPGATTENWWISEPDAEYADCRDSYVVSGSGNHHFNEKAMQIFAERSAANIHRILYLGLDPVLEEENIRGMQEEEELPEDATPYTSYVGTEVFCNRLSVSQKSNIWTETSSSSAASTNLIPVSSDDSVWIQYVFFKSDVHAVGGFYDANGRLVAPLWYEDFGFTADPNTGGVTAFRTPENTNCVSIAAIESATGKEIAFVRFTAWQASAGGHANTAARIYHSYTESVTAPTCTEQGYTTYTCACGESYVDDYVDATGKHTYENGICTGCGAAQPGDLNGDGKLNNKDVTRLMQYLAGWDVDAAVPPDINGDGKLNNKDVTRLMQYLAGWDVEIH